MPQTLHRTMHPTSRSNIFLVLALLTLVPVARAQFALFDQSTDTIGITGGTILGTFATIEAVVLLSDPAGGPVYFEQVSGLEHKSIYIADNGISGFGYTNGANTTSFTANTSISLNIFHHIAFVRDGSDERLYLDGNLLATRTVSGDIGDGSGSTSPAAIGAGQYDGGAITDYSFLGLLDSVRISNIARYAGATYTAPTGDMTSDANTLLLYNFNPGEISGSTITDMSGNGHTGTFASGFVGATAPTAIPEPSTYAALAGLGALGLAVWRRRRSA